MKAANAESYRKYGPLSPDSTEPVFAAKAVGAWIEDADGNRYLDFANGGSLSLGYNHPDIARLQLAAPGADGVVWQSEIDLMHKLAELVPGGMNRRVLVCDSGREALAKAVELARAATGRSHVSYLSDMSDEKPIVGKDVAVVVVHPLDGRVQQVRQACDAAGALVVDDETGIGPGTCGRMLALERATESSPPRHQDTKGQGKRAVSEAGVRPDVYVLGRGWAAGLPFGACVTRSSTLRWERGSSGNPVGCAAALETIRLLEGGLLEKGRNLAPYLDRQFEKLGGKRLAPVLWGIGLVKTLVFQTGRGVATGFVGRCRKNGLLLSVLSDASVAIRPPLVATEKDVDFAAEVVGKVLAEFDRGA